MRIVHVITRLILGGAQENTLLTVDELHHRYGDDVTLITGPAEGPEGDLFDRGADGASMSRSCPSWFAPSGPPSTGKPTGCCGGIPTAQARGRAHAQLEGGHRRPGRGLA